MTSMPEDGEIEPHHDESENIKSEASFQSIRNQITTVDKIDDDLVEDEEPAHLDHDDVLDEELRANSIDEANTIPEEATVSKPDKPESLGPGSPSLDESASIPDDTPSVQDSALSSPRSDALSLQPSLPRNGATPPRRPFDLRFQSRLSSSPIISPRASSPAFLHSRQSSLASFGAKSVSEPEELPAPWEVIQWVRLGKLTNQAFSEAGRRNFGSPTCLAVTENTVVGTSKGIVLVFDSSQSLRAIIGQGTPAIECGAIAALAVSADHTTIAVGHNSGHIFTWEITRPSKPFLHIPPIDISQPEARRGDGHVIGSTVLHIGFLGFRRTALVSADDHGMAFSHLASRGTGALGRTVKTTRILGRYPELISRTTKPTKKSSVLAFSPLPLGNVEQRTDTLGLVAMLTPYLLVIVSTTPIAQTQHKAARPKEVSAHSAMTAALAWFPAIKLKGENSATSRSKLVYAWSDVLTVLEIHEVPSESEDEKEKPADLQFVPRSRYKTAEAVVAVQWLSRSVIAALTITQQLLIIEDGTMTVTDSFDLLPKDVYHADVYSQQLQAVIENLDEEDTSMHGVVADAFHMSFRSYKGRLYLLSFKTMWWGSLTNWAARLIAMMDAADFIGAIRLATSYFVGTGEKLTIGLPEDHEQRALIVRDKLLDIMSASLKYAFGKNEKAGREPISRDQLVDLAVACIEACLSLDDKDFLFDEVFAWYDDHDEGAIFVDVLEPHILDGKVDSLPPPVIKTLINHFKTTHSSSKLEEVICLLDPRAMDIDQVTNLCKQNNLYEAYIYVWNTALQDYTSPLKELLDMAAKALLQNGNSTVSESKSNVPYKMFAYLSFVLTGRVYPTGLFMDEATANLAKLQLYDYLFSGDDHNELRQAETSTSYPSLRQILSVDTPSFMSALNEAFEDSFLNDDEVMNGVGSASSPVKTYTRLKIVRILLAVMSTGFDAKDSIYLDMFIGRNLPKYPQYMLFTGEDLQETFMRLCHYGDEALRDDAQLSVEYLLTAYRPPDALKLVPVLREALFYRVLKSIFRQEHHYADLISTYFLDPDDRDSVFEVIIVSLREQSPLTSEERAAVTQVVREHAQDLLDIDVSRTAVMVETVLPNLHSTFIRASENYPREQFRYLRSLIEPSQTSFTTKTSLAGQMTELYVRLMCQYDPSHVVEYIHIVKEDDLKLESVVPAMESSGIIDAAVILLARQGQIREAMDRLVKHIEVLQAALKGILQNLANSPDYISSQEATEDLLDSINRYTSVGIWICQGQKPKSAAKSPKLPATQQPLSFEEILWLDLIVSVVTVAQDIGRGSTSQIPMHDKIQNSLRTVVQRVFTALLSTTTSSREGSRIGSDFAFLRVLRAFLTRAAEISPTLAQLRNVIGSIFSAYAYEESLLSLSNAMLDKDLFVHVDEVSKLRQKGWRSRGQVCEICRRRVWGPGTGLKIWEAWESRESQRQANRRLEQGETSDPQTEGSSTGKGKAAIQNARSSYAEEQKGPMNHPKGESGPVVVFSCRHIYHQTCLLQNESSEGQEDRERHQRPLDNVQLRCPSCP